MSDLKFRLSQAHYWQVLVFIFFSSGSCPLAFTSECLLVSDSVVSNIAKYRYWNSETVSTHTHRCGVHTGPSPHTPLTCSIFLLIKRRKCMNVCPQCCVTVSQRHPLLILFKVLCWDLNLSIMTRVSNFITKLEYSLLYYSLFIWCFKPFYMIFDSFFFSKRARYPKKSRHQVLTLADGGCFFWWGLPQVHWSHLPWEFLRHVPITF